ncbi:hypothetical protein IX51_05545 [uncultured archaeon]|nr:hypothetical protein IX51_05545 [uncultured archaeon]
MVKGLPIKDVLNRNHPLSPLSDRVLITLTIFVISVIIATLVVKISEGWTLVNSFYYIAMITTTNGAPFPPTNPGVVIFTSFWAYFSFILLATLVVNAFGPLIGYLINEGVTYIKKAEQALEHPRGK